MNLFLNAEEAEASSPFIRGLRIIKQTPFRLHRTFERENSERDGALSPVAATPARLPVSESSESYILQATPAETESHAVTYTE